MRLTFQYRYTTDKYQYELIWEEGVGVLRVTEIGYTMFAIEFLYRGKVFLKVNPGDNKKFSELWDEVNQYFLGVVRKKKIKQI
jgi:hypothetical protein